MTADWEQRQVSTSYLGIYLSWKPSILDDILEVMVLLHCCSERHLGSLAGLSGKHCRMSGLKRFST